MDCRIENKEQRLPEQCTSAKYFRRKVCVCVCVCMCVCTAEGKHVILRLAHTCSLMHSHGGKAMGVRPWGQGYGGKAMGQGHGGKAMERYIYM